MFMAISSLVLMKTCLKIIYFRGRERESNSHPLVHSPVPEIGRGVTEASSQELKAGLPCGWQGPMP